MIYITYAIRMENFNKFNEIRTQLNLFYLEIINKKLTLEKKLELREKSKYLVNEAKQLIMKMQNEISNMNSNTMNNSQTDLNDCMINILENPHVNFNEVLDIVKQLQSIKQSIPTSAEIVNNLENDTKFEKNIKLDQDSIYEEEK